MLFRSDENYVEPLPSVVTKIPREWNAVSKTKTRFGSNVMMTHYNLNPELLSRIRNYNLEKSNISSTLKSFMAATVAMINTIN